MEAREVPFTVGASMNDPITVDLPKLVNTTDTPKSFKNGDFEADASESASITGWDIVEQAIIFGTDTIAGYLTPTDTVSTGTDLNTPNNSGSMEVTLSSAQYSQGSQSVRLTSTGITTQAGYDTVRGPALVSQESLNMKVADTMSFDWQARGGRDAYDVYAYRLNVDTGDTIEILNDTDATAGATTNW